VKREHPRCNWRAENAVSADDTAVVEPTGPIPERVWPSSIGDGWSLRRGCEEHRAHATQSHTSGNESRSDSQATQPRLSSPPSPFGLSWMVQTTGAAFQSRAVPPKRPRTPKLTAVQSASHPPPSTLKELRQQLPSCSERAAVYIAPGVSPSPYKSNGRPRGR